MKNEKLKMPTLRFKEFSDEWEEKNYGEIYTFYSTNSLSRDKLNYDDGTVKNIHYGDIHTKFSTMFNIKNETVPFINNDINLSKIKEENYCLEGDLVIADASEDYADIGKTIEIINLNNEKIIAGLHTFLARPDKYDMALGYSGYLLQSRRVRKQVMTIAQGTKVLSLSTTRLSKIKLNLPQKQEQEKIASFLSSVDKKIEQLSKKDELLHSYKKGAMQKIFAQEIRFSPKGTSSQAQGEKDGSDYPDWEEKELGSFTNIKTGNKDTQNKIENGKYPFFVRSNIIERINSFSFDGEAILTAGDGVGVGKVFHYLNEKFDYHQRVYNIHGFGNDIHGKYIFFYFKENFYKRVIKLSAKNSVDSVRMEMIYKMIIPLPCLEEQTKIANFLSSIDTKISQNTKALEETKKFKKALLQQMFV